MRKDSTIRAAKQGGFTLIELIIVIVIIGILAAVAIPKFANLTDDAHAGVAAGVASAAASASTVNYAKAQGSLPHTTVGDCSILSTMIDMPASGYTISAHALTAGSTGTCTVADDASTSAATFVAYGA